MILNSIKYILRKYFLKGTAVSKNATVQNSKIGEWVQITKNANVSGTKIGRYTSIGRNTNIYSSNIGSFCSISWNVTIGAPFHPLDTPSSHSFPYIKYYGFVSNDNKIRKTTLIGNDVWIGANAVIMPGLKIGDGAIIGAGSIVTKDVNSYEIVAGNPAKLLRLRFDPYTIKRLEEIKWWEWDIKKIQRNIRFFQKPLSEYGIQIID